MERSDEHSREIYEINMKVLGNQYIKDFFVSKFGENSLRIIKLATCTMTDDTLANKCKLKVSEIRTLLNKLHELGLASYMRIKDKEIGWYSYIWEINLKNAAAVVEREMLNEIKKLETQLDSATTVFSYYCPKCSRENVVDFDLAASLGFRCPNCDRPLKESKSNYRADIDRLNELRKKYALFKNSIKETS